MRAVRTVLVALGCAAVMIALSAPLQTQSVREWRGSHQGEILDEYSRLLRLPNIARNSADMRRNAEFIREMYARRGVGLQLLEVPDAPPAVFGELKTPGAAHTITLYAHYDGQPVVPAEWANNTPFEPELRDTAGKLLPWPSTNPFDPEWRLHARSASDDKAPIMAILAALDALKASGRRPSVNLKFFFDGEEEGGSPHLAAILTKYKSQLSSDGWVFCDGPMHPSRRPSLTYGSRGNMILELTIYGPLVELHSGHYGNWAPNPALMLAQLLTSMKDESGRVRIRGFYDEVKPLTAPEKRVLNAMPKLDAELMRSFALGSIEAEMPLGEAVTVPALNVQGIISGGVGAEARNVVPATATTSLGIRLVTAMDPKKTLNLVMDHIRRQGFFITEQPATEEMRRSHAKVAYLRPTSGMTRAVRTPLDSLFATHIKDAIEKVHGPVIQVLTSGGTLPIDAIDDVLASPVITLPIVNHDNNQHSHNENIRLKNLWDGIETMASLMTLDWK